MVCTVLQYDGIEGDNMDYFHFLLYFLTFIVTNRVSMRVRASTLSVFCTLSYRLARDWRSMDDPIPFFCLAPSHLSVIIFSGLPLTRSFAPQSSSICINTCVSRLFSHIFTCLLVVWLQVWQPQQLMSTSLLLMPRRQQSGTTPPSPVLVRFYSLIWSFLMIKKQEKQPN